METTYTKVNRSKKIVHESFYNFLKLLNREKYTTDYDGEHYTGNNMRIVIYCRFGHSLYSSYNRFVCCGERCKHNDHIPRY